MCDFFAYFKEYISFDVSLMYDVNSSGTPNDTTVRFGNI